MRLTADDGDRLWVSTARGIGWREVFVASGALLGFALSPDGATVAVGVPGDGVWVAPVSGLLGDAGAPGAFVRASALDARCLAWSDAGLYACAHEPSAGFAIGLSTDQGRSFVPLLRARDLSPEACAAGTSTGSTCAAVWPGVQAALGQEVDAGADAAADAGTRISSPPPATNRRACGCGAVRNEGMGGSVASLVVLVAFALRRRTR